MPNEILHGWLVRTCSAQGNMHCERRPYQLDLKTLLMPPLAAEFENFLEALIGRPTGTIEEMEERNAKIEAHENAGMRKRLVNIINSLIYPLN